MRTPRFAPRPWWLLATIVALAWMLAAVRPTAAQDGALAVGTVNSEEEIVYIDNVGYVRVYDPQTPANVPGVQFRSPVAGWYDAAVGDVNGDGDDEIIAIAENGLLTIYDPVVATSDVSPDQSTGGIYWKQLFETQLPDGLRLVTTGNIDANPDTLELVVVYSEPGGTSSTQLAVYYQPVAPFDGTAWLPLTNVTARERWSDITTGDLDGDGLDEISLVNENEGALAIYRRDPNNVLQRFWFEESDSRPWADAVIGNVDPSLVNDELSAVRNAAPPLASLIVRRYQPINQLVDLFQRQNLPAPRVIFLADVTGNGDEEIFLLRDVPSGDSRPRLYIANLGTDTPINFEAPLAADNGYRYGAGGDIDGDGKDEIAVIRDTGILIFTQPETSATITQSLTAPTNRRTIEMGNLDALGRDVLARTPIGPLNFSVAAGSISAVQNVNLSNITRDNAIPLYVTLAPQVSFVQATLTPGSTPATLSIQIDARSLLPISLADQMEDAASGVAPGAGVFTPTYGTNIIVQSNNPLVANVPLTIPVIVQVTAGIARLPSEVNLLFEPAAGSQDCQSSVPITVDVRMVGTAGSTFTASVEPASAATAGDERWPAAVALDWPSNVPWLSASSPTSTIPSTLSLTISQSPGLSNLAEAQVVLRENVPGVGTNIARSIPVRVACFNDLLYLPVTER